jgi:hypothetical protein|tara:strand:+ start:453 stop:737 length:285 start_codon:yes stop_codon:yes gene_type:complete
MKKAKIYKPAKTAMQSGKGNSKKWILEFETKNNSTNPLMGWESSNDTMSEVKLEFLNKDDAISYAHRHNISYNLIESKKNKVIIKSYSDNFLKK